MNPYWQFTLPMTPSFFLPITLLPAGIVWHNQAFQGFGEGIVEQGGPQELASAVIGFKEVSSLHRIIGQDPTYFFDVQGICWGYPGKVGYAPDFIGADSNGNIHTAEVKWQEGYDHDLVNQISDYAKNFWISNHTNRNLIIHIACPQGACRRLISSIIHVLSSLDTWRSIRFRFGFIQIGWRVGNNTQYYMRVVWLDGASWNGQAFAGQPAGLGLYDHTSCRLLPMPPTGLATLS